MHLSVEAIGVSDKGRWVLLLHEPQVFTIHVLNVKIMIQVSHMLLNIFGGRLHGVSFLSIHPKVELIGVAIYLSNLVVRELTLYGH